MWSGSGQIGWHSGTGLSSIVYKHCLELGSDTIFWKFHIPNILNYDESLASW